jgi:exosome complex component CSL4
MRSETKPEQNRQSLPVVLEILFDTPDLKSQIGLSGFSAITKLDSDSQRTSTSPARYQNIQPTHPPQHRHPTSAMSAPHIVLPGQTLGSTDSTTVGPGTHIHNTSLIASLAGPLTTTRRSKQPPTLSINLPNGPSLPAVGTTVLGRITRTNARQAHLNILALGPNGAYVCHDPFPAIIRQQDIRATEIDKVKVAESFRVGDVVRAVVISLGDERSYFCSTARNELGVVIARGEQGGQMVPVSWREVVDLETGAREVRKVAKPV